MQVRLDLPTGSLVNWETCECAGSTAHPSTSPITWCEKDHTLLCFEGERCTEIKVGRKFVLKSGMSYQVGDHAESHRSSATGGAPLSIVD